MESTPPLGSGPRSRDPASVRALATAARVRETFARPEQHGSVT